MTTTRSLFIALLTLSMAACVSAPAARDTVTLSIIGTNDVHGALIATDQVGGLVTVSAYVDALRQARAADGGAMLLIDAGDMWQGTLESNLGEGAAVVAAYNAMGVTAAALGNHEFDFGPEGQHAVPVDAGEDPRGNLKRRASEAQFPVLAANLIDTSTGAPVDWENVRPSVMVEAVGSKIGIVGVMTANALTMTIAANVGGLAVAPLAESVTTAARQLRDDGAVLIIVAAHAGGKCTDFSDHQDLSSCDMSAEVMRLANALEPGLVDYIIGGHTHNPIAHTANDIPITANHSNTYSFGRVDFQVDRERQAVVSRQVFAPQQTAPGTHDQYEGFPLVPNPDVEHVVRLATARAETLKQERLGVTLTGPFKLVPDIEAAIGNLMTQAMLDSFDADIAVHNVFGGIRAGLPAGDLTYGAVFNMFPFDNIVTVLDVSGQDLRGIIGRMAGTHRLPGFAGMRVFISCDEARMRVEMRLDDGRVIGDDDRIRLIANDFLALGGDDILTPAIPEGGFELRYDMPLTRDTLVAWFRAGPDTISPEDFRTHRTPKWNLPDGQPANCQY